MPSLLYLGLLLCANEQSLYLTIVCAADVRERGPEVVPFPSPPPIHPFLHSCSPPPPHPTPTITVALSWLGVRTCADACSRALLYVIIYCARAQAHMRMSTQAELKISRVAF